MLTCILQVSDASICHIGLHFIQRVNCSARLQVDIHFDLLCVRFGLHDSVQLAQLHGTAELLAPLVNSVLPFLAER